MPSGGVPGGLVRAGSPTPRPPPWLDDPPSPDGCQGGNVGTQGNDPSGVPLSEPPSGGYAKLPLPPPLPCQVSRGLQGSDPERQRPASPAAATGRPPPYTAINAGLSVNQRFALSIELSTSQPLYPYMAHMDQVDQILEPPVSTARHTGTPAAQMQAAYSSAAQPPAAARAAEEASSTLTISTVVQRPASWREEEQRLRWKAEDEAEERTRQLRWRLRTEARAR